MGIQGLLPLLHEASERKHLSDYAGKTLAVDAYVLLHRGLCTCAQEVATGQPTTKYADSAMGKIRMLQHFGVIPYVVLDGANLHSKQHTETDRAERRTEALTKAKSLLAQGQGAAARDFFLKACDVTPQMAYQMIKQLQRANIQYVVAPYEADAQMCYLEKEGLVDGLITEDSDLIVFGCKTVLFKMDKEGWVTEVKKERLVRCTDFRLDGFSEEHLRHMAILSGCDYLPSIPGVGIKSAHRVMRKYKCGYKAIKAFRLDRKFDVPRSYDKDFQRADVTFQHQYVYDPRARQAVPLYPLPAAGLSTAHLLAIGEGLTHKLAHGIALGNIDPSTKEAMVDLCPDEPVASTSRQPSAKSSSAVASSSKDIRAFFGPASAAADRKPLSKVPVNRFKGKLKTDIRSMLVKQSQTSPKQTFASRFFGGTAKGTSSVQSMAPTMLQDQDGEEDEVEFVGSSQSQKGKRRAEDDDDVEEMWQRTQRPATPKEEIEMDLSFEEESRKIDSPELVRSPSPVKQTLQQQPFSPFSAGGITSPENSPFKQQQLPSPDKSEEADETTRILTDDSFHFTSSPFVAKHPSSGSHTSSPSPIAKPTEQQQENVQHLMCPQSPSLKRKMQLNSDIEHFPESPAAASMLRSPPSKRRKSAPSAHQSRSRALSYDSDDDEANRSREAAESVAMSLRARFSYSSLQRPSSSTNTSPQTGLARAVKAAVSEQKQSSSTSKGKKRSSDPAPSSSLKPSAKLKRMNSSVSVKRSTAEIRQTAEQEREEVEIPTHWKKVSITSSRLAAFRK